jgi:hypothetical protein
MMWVCGGKVSLGRARAAAGGVQGGRRRRRRAATLRVCGEREGCGSAGLDHDERGFFLPFFASDERFVASSFASKGRRREGWASQEAGRRVKVDGRTKKYPLFSLFSRWR